LTQVSEFLQFEFDGGVTQRGSERQAGRHGADRSAILGRTVVEIIGCDQPSCAGDVTNDYLGISRDVLAEVAR
jgi:hypothetical protein